LRLRHLRISLGSGFAASHDVRSSFLYGDDAIPRASLSSPARRPGASGEEDGRKEAASGGAGGMVPAV
jgi:hypothetical protein